MGAFADFAARLPFLLVLTPLFGAVLVLINARRGVYAARQTAVVNATLSLAVAGAMLWNFSPDGASSPGRSPLQMTTFISWWHVPLTPADAAPANSAKALHIEVSFGVDGVSLGPLVLVALIAWVVLLTADRCGDHWSERSYAGLLLGQAAATAVFAAQDFTLFIVGCELWAWWSFFAIGRHGGAERRTAAHRFLVTSSLAHACWGLAGIGMAVCRQWIQAELRGESTGMTFLYPEMVWTLARWVSGNATALETWQPFESWILLLWISGLALRWPLAPIHAGWNGIVSEARAPIAAWCASVSMLQAGYVLFRFVIPLFPPLEGAWPAMLAGWAACGSLYFALLAVRETQARKLVGYLALWGVSCALICGLSGVVDVSLAGWQIWMITALATAGCLLLIGWRERTTQSDDVAAMMHTATPRWRALLLICVGTLTAIPGFALLSGQAWVVLWELRRRGSPHLMLLLSGVLTGWAMIRLFLQKPVDSPDAVPANRDLQGRELLIGLLAAAILFLSIAPGVWQDILGPTWERLHDPFAVTNASVTTPAALLESQPVRVVARKPGDEVIPRPALPFPWRAGPLVWVLAGVGLTLLPRRWLSARAGSIVSVAAIVGGVLAEIGLDAGANQASHQSTWPRAVTYSLAIIGLCRFTNVATFAHPLAVAAAGAWLLRLAAVGWIAVTNDLLLAGLGWELAELARWLSQAGESVATTRPLRERYRHLISSACFWSGIALCLCFTGTTDLGQLAARLSETIPRNGDGHPLGPASRFGLAAMILLVSAVGMRAGLLPWSFGRRDLEAEHRCGPVLLDQWLGQLLGVAMLVRVVPAFSASYPAVSVMLTIASASTALWAALSVVNDEKVRPVISAALTMQTAGLVLLVATLSNTGAMDRIPLWPVLAGWCLAIGIAVGGLTAIIAWLGEPEFGPLFFEHYRGVMAKRRWSAAICIGLCAAIAGRSLTAAFWPVWLGLIGIVMTPQRLPNGDVQTNAVLLCGGILWALSAVGVTSRLAYGIRIMTFDPPGGTLAGSARGWDFVVAAMGLAVLLAAGVCPAWFAAIWV